MNNGDVVPAGDATPRSDQNDNKGQDPAKIQFHQEVKAPTSTSLLELKTNNDLIRELSE